MPGIPVINSFTANAYTIDKGASVTLSWSTSFCTWVKLNGSSVGLSGSKSFTPLTTTTYTLTTMGDRGAPSKSLTVNVAGSGGGGGGGGNGGGGGGDIVICVPGDPKCIGLDLYRCNTAGTAWVLETKNSPICKIAAVEPDFWTSPIVWILWAITSTVEAIVGFVSGQFTLFIGSLKSFWDTYVPQLVDFIQDPIKHIAEWVDSLLPGLREWLGGIADGIGSWWDDQVEILQRGWDNTVAGIGNWWDDQVEIFQRGWDNTVDDINKWKDEQVLIFQRGWDKVGEDRDVWFDEQKVILQRGWDNTFSKVPGLIAVAVDGAKTWVEGFVSSFVEAITNSFFEGLTRGVEESGHSPLDVEKETENDILKGLQGYMIKYRNERDKKKVR